MSANRVLQHSGYIACSCAGPVTVAPAFDFSTLVATVGDVRPFYFSLSGAATTNDWFLSTGQQIVLPLPSIAGSLSFTCTSSGGQLSYTLLR